jgi:hypothetical protein
MLKRIIIAIYILIISTTVYAVPDTYIWPLKLRPELTSKFCDYRAGHFHGGLDVRTGGRIGVPIYAISDGYVFRVVSSFTGYGRALYLKLNDDRIIVFGHLSGFLPVLDERIRSAQLSQKKYYQDLYFTSSEIPVKKGQLIAYSGESGTGAPHLHFEMRSSQNNPINPLESGYSMTDKVPPEFDYLAIRYYKHGFSPGNPNEIEFIPIVRGKDGYTIADTVISDDYLALAVAGGDRIDAGGFFYGYYGLKLFVDDSLRFFMESDSLSYNTTRQLNYVRDLELIRLFATKSKTDNDLGIFYRLYFPPGANQYFWPGLSDDDGVIAPVGVPGALHRVRIEAYDESGNRSELRFYVKSPNLPLPDPVSYQRIRDTMLVDFVTASKINKAQVEYRDKPSQAYKTVKCSISSLPMLDGKTKNRLSYQAPVKIGEYRFSFHDDRNHCAPWVYFHGTDPDDKFSIYGSPDYLCTECVAQSKTARLKVANFGLTQEFEMKPEGPNCFRAEILNSQFIGRTSFMITGDNGVIIDTMIALYPVTPGGTRDISTPDNTLSLSFQSHSAYYPTYVFPSNGVRTSTAAGMGIVYDIKPDIMLVDTPIKYSFDVAKLSLAGKKVGVYGYSYSSGGWNFIGKINGTSLEANGFGLGKVALLEDNDPPVISSVSPSGVSKNRAPTISCTLSDRVSGMALDSGLAMTIDGAWVPAEYDIDGSRFSYKVRTPLKSGRHKLEITASDNQGNSATRVVDFTIPAK